MPTIVRKTQAQGMHHTFFCFDEVLDQGDGVLIRNV